MNIKRIACFFTCTVTLICGLDNFDEKQNLCFNEFDENQQNNIINESNNIDEYLSIFDNKNLNFDDDITTFSGELILNSSIHESDCNKMCAVANGDTAVFQAKAINKIGIIDIKISNINSLGVVTGEENVYGFPCIKSDGTRDVLLDLHGRTTYCTKVMDLNKLMDSFKSTEVETSYLNIDAGKETNTVMPVASIAMALSNFADVKTLASKYIVIPDLMDDGPVAYAFYSAKMQLALNHYEHNKNLKSQPSGYIYGQSKFKDWKFGLSNLADGGCGIIALYNMLVNYKANPDLATLVALCELGNVDLVFGYCGTNPLPSELVELIKAAMIYAFDFILVPILAALIPVIAATILNYYIATSPWWVSAILCINYIPDYLALTAALEGILLVAAIAVPLILDFYAEHLHNIGDILEVLLINDSYYSLDKKASFEQNLDSGDCGILAMWNEKLNNTGIPNFAAGAHYVFLKKDRKSGKYIVWNLYSNDSSERNCTGVDEVINTGLYLWGFVVHY